MNKFYFSASRATVSCTRGEITPFGIGLSEDQIGLPLRNFCQSEMASTRGTWIGGGGGGGNS